MTDDDRHGLGPVWVEANLDGDAEVGDASHPPTEVITRPASRLWLWMALVGALIAGLFFWQATGPRAPVERGVGAEGAGAPSASPVAAGQGEVVPEHAPLPPAPAAVPGLAPPEVPEPAAQPTGGAEPTALAAAPAEPPPAAPAEPPPVEPEAPVEVAAAGSPTAPARSPGRRAATRRSPPRRAPARRGDRSRPSGWRPATPPPAALPSELDPAPSPPAAGPAGGSASSARVAAAEGKPAEASPAEAKPAEAKPAEAKPAEAKPAVAQPAEAKPAEAKVVEARPVAAAPTPAPEEGYVSVTASVSGSIFVDGVDTGKRPPLWMHRVAAGSHVIELRDAGGQVLAKKSVSIPARQTVPVLFRIPGGRR